MRSEREATSRTLLERVRDPGDTEAWQRFYVLYAPLIEGFARRSGLSEDDVLEVRDECLALVSHKLREFEYDRARGAFQGWLYRLTRGKVIDHLRRPRAAPADTALLADLSTDDEAAPDQAWERSWREQHLRFALRQAAERVSERTYQTFQLLLLENCSVPEVCERMGMNPNQVYKAKARALTAVREVLERLGIEPPAG